MTHNQRAESRDKENTSSNNQYPGLKLPPGSWIENGFIMTPEIKEENGQKVKYIYKQKIVEKHVPTPEATDNKSQAQNSKNVDTAPRSANGPAPGQQMIDSRGTPILQERPQQSQQSTTHVQPERAQSRPISSLRTDQLPSETGRQNGNLN